MKKDIILGGVGGQGILTIATIIGEAATAAGLYLKQAEVHGMSQRGGDVQSTLRLSTEPINAGLIAEGAADLIIAMEPMEALRYLPYLAKDGVVVASSCAVKNIAPYPEAAALDAAFARLPHVALAPLDDMAREAGMPKCANVILLGMAARHIEILTPQQLRDAALRVFAAKGDAIAEMNGKAFDLGCEIGGE